MVLRQANTQRELSRRRFNPFLSAQSDPPIHKRAAPLQERENLPDDIGERFAPRSASQCIRLNRRAFAPCSVYASIDPRTVSH